MPVRFPSFILLFPSPVTFDQRNRLLIPSVVIRRNYSASSSHYYYTLNREFREPVARARGVVLRRNNYIEKKKKNFLFFTLKAIALGGAGKDRGGEASRK